MRHRKYENRRGGGRLGRHRKVTKFADQRTPLAKDFEGRNEAPKKDDEDLILPNKDVEEAATEGERAEAKVTEGKKLTNREKHALMKQKNDERRKKQGKPVSTKVGDKKKIQSDDGETGKRKRGEFGPDYDEDGVPSLMKPLVLPKIPRLEDVLANMEAMRSEEKKEEENDENKDESDDEEPVTERPAFGDVIEAPPVFSKKAASVGQKAAKHSNDAASKSAVIQGVTGWRRQVKGKSLESLVKSVEARYEH
ncbi:hypothetical protein FOL47_010193 [Perkinsus chesapeaki]|uniref:Uncharacterized protein n=1 Tax=Perkinsus chesapeaki TaxID=330153 RepID=A0A7J6MQ59_PERCH|nr:hypothetical protein FOL47_010193 [Perkinsus chesapeaki]